MSDMLMQARCRLMVREPWYGHIAMSLEWVPSQMTWIPEQHRTMGIRVVQGGIIQVLYYPPYTNSRTIKQLFGEIQHVIEHMIRLHMVRGGGREKETWNVATDMVVNGKQANPRIGYPDEGKRVLPHDNMIFCPNDVSDELTAEEYYKLLEKEGSGGAGGKGKGGGQQQQKGGGKNKDKDKNKQKQKGEGDQDQQGQDDGGGSQENPNSTSHGDTVDDHSTWGQSDCSEDEARQLVRDICNQASQKAVGRVPGHLKEALKALEKPTVRWRELLRRYMGTYVGSRRWTHSRRNRRYEQFGNPGISHHAAARVSVIVDTSGSVSTRMLQKFFAEIEAITHRARVHVLQWDHAFQGYGNYRRNDWKKFVIHGRGGTDMDAPVKWLEEQGLIGDVCIMLTDGIVSAWPKQKKFPAIFVIANENDNGAGVKAPDWGHTVRVTI